MRTIGSKNVLKILKKNFKIISIFFSLTFMKEILELSGLNVSNTIYEPTIRLLSFLIIVYIFYHYLKRLAEIKEKLRFNESFGNSVLENMEDGITIYDKQGQVLYSNEAARTFGISEIKDPLEQCSEVYGLYYPNWTSHLLKEDLPISKILHGESVYNQEVWVMPKGKPLRVLLFNGKPVQLSSHDTVLYLMMAQDATQRRWTEQRLAVSEQRFKSLFKHNPDMVFWIDVNGRFLGANAVAETIIGYEERELLQKSYRDVMADDEVDQVIKQFKQTIKGEPQTFESRIMNSEKDVLEVNVTVMPITVDQNIVGVYAVVKDITERKKTDEMVQYLAYHDTLTGLANRRLFYNELSEAFSAAKQHDHIVGLMFLDLDRFKFINDTLGHDIGDLLLVAVARRLEGCISSLDTISRLGGDEFTFILPNSTREKTAKVAKKISEVLSQVFIIEGQEVYITASIGISIYPSDGGNIETLIKHADTAMYAAKDSGKDNFRFYTPSMNEVFSRHMLLEKGLREALKNNELELYYQPKIHIITGQVVGFEALIRWNHPYLGLVSPAEFIPLAEETGLIIPIGKWVLRSACLQARIWQQQGYSFVKMAVNLSVVQFQDEGLISEIIRVLAETGLAHDSLELEITEGISIDDNQSFLAKLIELKALGIRISIDDFGKGYSSLSYLQKLPIDTLKIDKSFIQGMTSEKGIDLVEAILTIGHQLNLTIVAEGVEEPSQLEMLRRLGCDELQGYLFSKPIPAEAVEEKLIELGQIKYLEHH
ncbi:EAL domain-containing protein [Bacillus suaedae]|uniref:EAL domain-containing protein n=1 Tax=Halalkalibacter suaedae TaxID=2822140 RepID=A0A940WRW0_9BACI|nr:EAL domain-containing protein [Bacillus suaedae]MBP3951559.1 EAL domain-containing protein [Bacillus suaedae]